LTRSTLTSLARFLPGALVEWAGTISPDSPRPPCEEHICALLDVDVSGFTRLTSRLSRDSSQAGAERIGVILNGHLSKLIGVIEQHGGVILSFEGDSLLAGWQSEAEPALRSAVWHACACALALQRQFGETTVEGEALTLRSGISAGRLESVHLLCGSEHPRLLLAGQSIEDVCHCISLADGGETFVSARAWTYVADTAKGQNADKGAIRLLDIAAPSPSPFAHDGPATPSADLIDYVPSVVRAQFATALSEWAAELRTITTLFIRVTAVDLLNDFSKVEHVADVLQQKIERVGGDLLRVTAIEGGIQVLAVCGLPGNAHQDNPRRAIVGALDIQTELGTPEQHVSIGIASGDAFCGAIGTERRAEYTVLGESVNCAARLSSLAAGRILADDVTAKQTVGSIELQGPWPMSVPGLRTAIPAYIAVRKTVRRTVAMSNRMVGRHDELLRLKSSLNHATSGPSVSVIVGEPGVGKSTLAAAFMDDCEKEGIEVFDAFTDEIEKNTPYYALRRPLKRLLRLDQVPANGIYARIEERLAGNPGQLQFISLLNDILDLDLPQSAAIHEMQSSVRSDNLRRLLKNLLLALLCERPRILLIEDYHWIDAASTNLLAELVSSGKPIRLVLTSRNELARDDALRTAHVQLVRLDSLDEANTAELIKLSLQGTDISRALEDAIWQRTGGNPFFIAELCRVIQQRQDFPVEPPGDDPSGRSLGLPQSARAAVLNRTDNLSADGQFLLKVASAMGPAFRVSDFEDNELIRKAGLDVAACISRLESANLLKHVDAGRFTFSHRIIRDVVYASMLSDQKKAAHASIAIAVENSGRVSSPESLSLLLYQWKRAGNREKIFAYLDRVAELRLRQFENDAAIAHCVEFLGMAEEDKRRNGVARLAAAHFIMGKAQINLGKLEAARISLEHGLRILKLPMPRTKMGLGAAILGQTIRQVVNASRVRRQYESASNPNIASDDTDDITLKVARAYDDLTNIFYFQGNKARLIYSTLRGTTLAEHSGALSPVLAINYACIGAICGVIPLRNYADHYLRLGESISSRLQIPSVSVRVSLVSGLYKTSIGEWSAAKKLFEPALAEALQIGDVRKWCEIAVCLETIISPWLLNPGYEGEQAWAALIEEIIEKARSSGDVQILGSGLAGAIRGYRTLDKADRNAPYLQEFASLLRERTAALEPIHRLEGAAHLADAALDDGDIAAWQHWLERAGEWLGQVNPSMKTRTLPALCAAFRAGIRRPNHGDASRLGPHIATRSLTGLRRFARIYPIGRPRALLFRGDMEALQGHPRRAAKLWGQAIAHAQQLDMPADALAAEGRLKKCEGSGTAGERAGQSAPSGLDHFPEYRKIMGVAAIALNVGGGGNAVPSPEAARAAGPGAL